MDDFDYVKREGMEKSHQFLIRYFKYIFVVFLRKLSNLVLHIRVDV